MTCVYCASEQTSREHWFPKSFGRFKNYELLLDRVCARCNQATKVAEQALAQYGVTGFLRQKLAIAGRRRDNSRRSAFLWNLKEIPPQKLKMSYPGVPCRIFGEILPDGRLSPLFQLIVRRGSEIFAVLLPDWVKSRESLMTFLGPQSISVENIEHLAGPSGPVPELFRELFPEKVPQQPITPPLPPKIHQEWTVATGILHARAVAKIGFHYLLKYWGDRFTGRETEFGEIREFIQGRYPDSTFWPQFAMRHERDKRLVRKYLGHPHHLVSVRQTWDRIEANVHFFVGVNEVLGPDTWTVKLGPAPGKIAWESMIAHHFKLFPSRLGEWNGEFVEGPPTGVNSG